MSPHFLQLIHATGSDGFAVPPCPTGHVWICAQHMAHLWVSGLRLLEVVWTTFEGCSLSPLAPLQFCEPHAGAWDSSRNRGGHTHTPWDSLALLSMQTMPSGEGSWLTFNLSSSKPSSNNFLFTEGPVVSGPCLLPIAPWLMTMTPWLQTMANCTPLVAQPFSQEPGPGLSASRIPGNQAQGISVEGPSSAQSGSSQPPTASSMPGREQQEMGASPLYQQVLCWQHHGLLRFCLPAICPMSVHCRPQLRDYSREHPVLLPLLPRSL